MLKVQPLRWVNLYQGFLIAHYLLAVYYVRQGTFGQGRSLLLSILLLTALTFGSYFFIPNTIFLLFGIHYAFGEAYNFRHIQGVSSDNSRLLIGLLIGFHLCTYLYAFSFNLIQVQIIYDVAQINFSSALKFLSLLLYAGLVGTCFLFVKRGTLKLVDFALIALTEALFLWASFELAGTKYPFIVAIFYHITFWLVGSLYKTVKHTQNYAKFFNLIIFNALFVLISFVVTQKTSDIFVGRKDMVMMDVTIYVLGFFHIYSSLFNESLNPAWMKNFFRWKKCSSLP